MKRQQRGFVRLPGTAAKPANGGRLHHRVHGSRRLALWAAVQRSRTFVSGLLLGLGVWTTVFAAMNQGPRAWVAAGLVFLLGLAAGARRAG